MMMLIIIMIHKILVSQKVAGHGPLSYSGIEQTNHCWGLNLGFETKRCCDTEEHLDPT